MDSRQNPGYSQKAEISELVARWAASRDQGRWDDLAGTFTAQGEIRVSWFSGQHAEFVHASRKRHGANFNRHVMLGTLAEVQGKRAWAESAVMMLGAGTFAGVPVHWTSHFRFIDRLVRNDAGWRLQHRTAVYDVDAITPDISGTTIPFDMALLERFPRHYRFLACRLAAAGLDIPSDLPTFGSEAEAEVRVAARDWITTPDGEKP